MQSFLKVQISFYLFSELLLQEKVLLSPGLGVLLAQPTEK